MDKEASWFIQKIQETLKSKLINDVDGETIFRLNFKHGKILNMNVSHTQTISPLDAKRSLT